MDICFKIHQNNTNSDFLRQRLKPGPSLHLRSLGCPPFPFFNPWLLPTNPNNRFTVAVEWTFSRLFCSHLTTYIWMLPHIQTLHRHTHDSWRLVEHLKPKSLTNIFIQKWKHILFFSLKTVTELDLSKFPVFRNSHWLICWRLVPSASVFRRTGSWGLWPQ